MKVETLRERYFPVLKDGFTRSLPDDAIVQIADLHTHPHVDSRVGVKRLLTAAAEKEVDWLAITDHNEGGDEQSVRKIKRLRDTLGIPINIISASETTALPVADLENRKGKHVLVFDQKEHIEPFQSWERLYQEAERQEALLFPAHIEMGQGRGNRSYTRDEIRRMVDNGLPPDGIEGYNGSGALLDRFEWALHPLQTSRFIPRQIRELVPPPGSNQLTIDFYEEYKEVIPGISVGSDDHEGTRVAETVLVLAEGADIYQSMRAGAVDIYEMKQLAPLQPFRMIDSLLLEHYHIGKPRRHTLQDGLLPSHPPAEDSQMAS
jgi:hypothetical protein